MVKMSNINQANIRRYQVLFAVIIAIGLVSFSVIRNRYSADVTTNSQQSITAPINLLVKQEVYDEYGNMMVLLTWDYLVSNDIDNEVGFKVLKDGQEVMIFNTAETGLNNPTNGGLYYDTNVEVNKEYTYAVIAFDRGDNESLPVEIKVTVSDPL